MKGFSEIFQGFGAITDGFKKALDLGGHLSDLAAIGQTRVQMALFGMSIKQQGINLITLRGVATTAFAGIAGAAKVAGRGILSAFGPVGLILMAATETLGFFMKKMQQATDTARAMNGMVKGFIKDVNRNNTSIRTVSNEEERGNVKSDIEQQTESTSEALANADEDYAHLGEKGLKEAKTRLERHLRLLEKQRESLANLSPEIIKANAADATCGSV